VRDPATRTNENDETNSNSQGNPTLGKMVPSAIAPDLIKAFKKKVTINSFV
jgi:hypothetical protein